MPLPPTPWIRTYDNPALYLQGYNIGLEAAQTAQRNALAQQELANRSRQLEQQAADEQMKLDAQMKIAERNRAIDEHKLRIENEYRQQQIALQQDRLREVSKVNALKTQQDIRRQSAIMEYQQSVAGGKEDPVAAALRLGPAMGVTGPGLASLAKVSRQPEIPESLQGRPILDPRGKEIPGMIGLPTSTGGLIGRDIPGYKRPGSVTQEALFYANQYRDQLKEKKAQMNRFGWSMDEEPKDKNARARWKKLTNDIYLLEEEISKLVPKPGSEPMASDEEEPTDSGFTDIGGFRVRVKSQ